MQEIWKDIEGYEGYYQVSNLGRVKSLGRYVNGIYGIPFFKNCKIKKQPISKTGYYVVSLWKNNKVKLAKTHRLIAQAFINNTENKPFINHKDLNKLNNSIDNLEWVTHKENIQHAAKHGVMCGNIGTGKNIVMLNKYTNEKIKTFHSTLEIKDFLNIKETASIYKCINMKRKSAYGYNWEYE